MWWKSNKYYTFWECVCSLRYPACNAQVAYCHMCSAPICNIVAHYLTNGTIFEKKMLLNIKCVLTFCITFTKNISHSKSNWAIYKVKCILVSIWSACCYCHQILMNLEFSRQTFEKILNYQILWKPWSVGRVVPCGRTDGQTGMTK
jgi:hypothetical protein